MTIEDLMDVGIRELRDSLSQYPVEVERGHTVTVTDHEPRSHSIHLSERTVR